MAGKARGRPPECFADLSQVFPLGEDGLRHTPAECLSCAEKTECLRAALTSRKGVAVHEERLNRACEAGQVGFLERWARRKSLEKQRDPNQGICFWRRWVKRGS